ncbi:MAG: ankyrin repeat domain-containing protein [Sterolibacteriaceae bacterium MAG5]|nr:ankyrin repeat domain-containing protein [Candidatus Nitricoxidireducens bremensis]
MSRIPPLSALLAVLALGFAAAPVLSMETLGKNEQPIHDAARMGTREDVERLLKADPKLRDARTELGSTPLHYAALNENSGPLRALLAAGANVNARDKEGATPLHMAAYATRSEHTKLLLEAGADVNAKTDAGRDVLSLARRVRADEVAGIISLWVLKGCKPSKPC